MGVTVRNVLDNGQQDLQSSPNKSLKQAVQDAGLVHGDFSIRDKLGSVIDDQPVSTWEGKTVFLGLPGRTVEGG